MSAPTITHRVIRRTVETQTVERLNRDGTAREVELVDHVTSCQCGRVFRTGSELLTLARFLEHLPPLDEPDRKVRRG